MGFTVGARPVARKPAAGTMRFNRWLRRCRGRFGHGQASRPALLRGRRRGGQLLGRGPPLRRQRAGGDQAGLRAGARTGREAARSQHAGPVAHGPRGAVPGELHAPAGPAVRRRPSAGRARGAARAHAGRGRTAATVARAAGAGPGRVARAASPRAHRPAHRGLPHRQGHGDAGCRCPGRPGLAGQRRPRSAATSAEPTDHLRQPGLLAAARHAGPPRRVGEPHLPAGAHPGRHGARPVAPHARWRGR